MAQAKSIPIEELPDILDRFSTGQLDSVLDGLGIVLEAVLPAQEAIRQIENSALLAANVDQFPPNSAKEMKIKPRFPGIPGFPGQQGNPPVPGNPGQPGQPGFPNGESHADIQIYVCRKGVCDFVIVHRKIVIPAGGKVRVRWNRKWCKVVVESQLGVVIVQANNRDLFITPDDGKAVVQSLRPPCPPNG